MIALSTAYKEALVAVEIDSKKALRSLDANCKHSENLLLTLDEALSDCGKTLAENDNYAVVVGPGSFTGVRISSALVKGLLAGENKENVLPLTTFELMAYSYITNFSPKEDFVCIINALSGNYFVCKFSPSMKEISPPQMIDASALSEEKSLKVGLKEEGIGDVFVRPTAEELLALAKEKLAFCPLISAEKLVPIYLRKSQAEASLEEKEKNQKNA